MSLDGILVPGGFGKRGIPGMLKGIEYARTRKVPYFGICLGMQCAVIEYARNVCGLEGADSSEFDPSTPHRVIYKLRELRGIDELGGTMRLGAWTARLKPGSFAHQAYGTAGDFRAPPPPLRIQPRVRRDSGGERIGIDRDDSRRHLCGDRGNPRPSLVPGLPVSSGIQVPAPGAPPTFHGVRQCGLSVSTQAAEFEARGYPAGAGPEARCQWNRDGRSGDHPGGWFLEFLRDLVGSFAAVLPTARPRPYPLFVLAESREGMPRGLHRRARRDVPDS